MIPDLADSTLELEGPLNTAVESQDDEKRGCKTKTHENTQNMYVHMRQQAHRIRRPKQVLQGFNNALTESLTILHHLDDENTQNTQNT